MMTLVRLIPFILGPYVDEDDDHWECFRLFWAMCDLLCTYEVHQDDPQHLGWIIQTYLEIYTMLYPDDNVTPKMHYLVHLPGQMAEYVLYNRNKERNVLFHSNTTLDLSGITGV